MMVFESKINKKKSCVCTGCGGGQPAEAQSHRGLHGSGLLEPPRQHGSWRRLRSSFSSSVEQSWRQIILSFHEKPYKIVK